MAKITSKTSLVIGTNVKLHIADKGGTDIAITDNADGTVTITSTTTDFVASKKYAETWFKTCPLYGMAS